MKKLAQPERADRLHRQQSKLRGIRIEGKLEPSERLVDLAVSLYEENRLQHIELSRCTSKEQEVLNSSQREDKHVVIDATGAVRVRDREHKMEADLSTDTFVRLALMRRELALDQANLLDYLEHDRWVERVFDCRTAMQPSGYNGISIQQIINADRKLFVKLAEGTRSGIQTTASGRPLDAILRPPMNTPMFYICFSLCRAVEQSDPTSLELISPSPRSHARRTKARASQRANKEVAH